MRPFTSSRFLYLNVLALQSTPPPKAGVGRPSTAPDRRPPFWVEWWTRRASLEALRISSCRELGVLPIRHHVIDCSHGGLRARYVFSITMLMVPSIPPYEKQGSAIYLFSAGLTKFRRRGEAFRYLRNAISQPSA